MPFHIFCDGNQCPGECTQDDEVRTGCERLDSINAYRSLVGNPKSKNHSEDVNVDWRIILKCSLKNKCYGENCI
jgi:hypothetical protein